MANEGKNVMTDRYPQVPVEEKTLGRVTFLALALVLFGIFPLGGLPGLLIFELFVNTVIATLPGSHMWCRLHASALVPFTLCLTFLWPLSLPVGYVIAFKKCHTYSWPSRVLLWLVVMMLWGALLSVALCLVGASAAASLAVQARAVLVFVTSTGTRPSFWAV